MASVSTGVEHKGKRAARSPAIASKTELLAMHILHDEDEWECVSHHRVCSTCQGDLRKCNGMCNGMSGYSMVKRKPDEVAKIKAKKQKEREDAILAQADAIRARRS